MAVYEKLKILCDVIESEKINDRLSKLILLFHQAIVLLTRELNNQTRNTNYYTILKVLNNFSLKETRGAVRYLCEFKTKVCEKCVKKFHKNFNLW